MRIFLTILFCLYSTFAWGGVDFDGTDDYSLASDSTSLSVTGNITLAAWIIIDAAPAAEGYIIAKWQAAAGERSYRIDLNSTPALRGILSSDGTGNSGFAIGATTLSTATIYHVAFVYNGTDMRLYLNGILDENGANNPKTYSSGIFDNATPVLLGAGGNGVTQGGFINAKILDSCMLNKALTADQIYDLYASKNKLSCVQIAPANQVAYWRLDDQPDGTSVDGDTFRDMSSNANTSTGNNGANNTGLTAVAETVLTYP